MNNDRNNQNNLQNYDACYLIIFFIIILCVIVALYYYFSKNNIEHKIHQLILEKNQECKFASFSSQILNINYNQCIVFIGEIPQNYVYWSSCVFNENGIPLESINMRKYQTVHPGSNFAIIYSSNKYAILEAKKILECHHYEKFSQIVVFILMKLIFHH